MSKRERKYHKRRAGLKNYLSKAHPNDAIAAIIRQIRDVFPMPKYPKGGDSPTGPEIVGNNYKPIIFSRSKK